MQATFRGFGRILIVSGTSLPFPPVSVGSVDFWNRVSTVHDSFEIEVRAAAPVTLSDGEVWGAAGDQVTIPQTSITLVDSASDTLTAVAHGLASGDGPIRLSGDDLPGGLPNTMDYYVSVVTVDTFKLSKCPGDSLNGTVMPISDNGSGAISYEGSLPSDVAQDGNNSYRLCWFSYGKLRPDGSDIELDVLKGYRPRVDHSPRTVAYAVSGILSTPVSVTISAYPVQEA